MHVSSDQNTYQKRVAADEEKHPLAWHLPAMAFYENQQQYTEDICMYKKLVL